jgi:hypothetical protein
MSNDTKRTTTTTTTTTTTKWLLEPLEHYMTAFKTAIPHFSKSTSVQHQFNIQLCRRFFLEIKKKEVTQEDLSLSCSHVE